MALTKLAFDPVNGWNDTIEFPENPDDSQVRPLLQKLHDETKAYLNNVLTAEIEGTMATKAELAGVVAGGIPAGTISVDMLDFDPTEQPEFDIHIADYVRNPGYALSTGSLNAYAITVDPVITSYIDGMSFKVKWHLANTAASSLNVCGVGIVPILDSKGNVLTADKLKTVSTVVYYNGNFILQGEGSDVLTGNLTAIKLLTGSSGYSNDPLTKINGTMPNFYGNWQVSSPIPIAEDGRIKMFPPKGYYDPDSGTGVFYDDANFIASNLVAGKSYYGLVGTAKRSTSGSGTSNSAGACTVSGVPFTITAARITINGITFICFPTINSNAYVLSSSTSYTFTINAGSGFVLSSGQASLGFTWEVWE